MIKKLLLLLLLIVFVNPIFAQIKLGIKQRGATTALQRNRVDYRKPDGVKTGDIMIVTIAQKERDSDPVSMGWTLVAGADLEEGREG
jgi:uncharacterized protein YdeI (BOF family)